MSSFGFWLHLAIPLHACFASVSAPSDCNVCSDPPEGVDDRDVNVMLQAGIRVVGSELGRMHAGLPVAPHVALKPETPESAARAAAKAAGAAAEAAAVAAAAATTAAHAAAASADLPDTSANRSQQSASARSGGVVGMRWPVSTKLEVETYHAATAARAGVETKYAAAEAEPDGNEGSLASEWTFVQTKHMLHGVTLAMIVKALCVMGNVLVQVSPLPQVRRWDNQGCTGGADPAPYVAIAFSGLQWCFYGFFAWVTTSGSGFLILVQSNCLGAILGAYYVRTFYANCCDHFSLASLQKYISAISALVLLQLCAMCAIPADRALFLTGIIACCGSFTNAASMLVTVPAVFREKSSRSILVPYVVANLVSAVLWSSCGIMIKDPLVITPNVFAVFCSVVALGVKAAYPSDDFLAAEEEAPGKKASVARAFARSIEKPAPTKLSNGIWRRVLASLSSSKQQTATTTAAAQDGVGDGADGTGGTS